MNPGQNEDLEKEQKSEIEEPTGEPNGKPIDLKKIHDLIQKQNKTTLLLTNNLLEITTKLEKLEKGQDISDAAIIKVAKRVGDGGGGGGGGGKGDIISQILPYIMQPRGQSPFEKIAMQSFMRNMAFASLTTERIAKKQFGEEYTKMVKEMEGEFISDGKPSN